MAENKNSIQSTIKLFSNEEKYYLEDYVVSTCNEHAVNAVFSSELGFMPYPTILIVKGGKSSGKSFLASICQTKRNGIFITKSLDLQNFNSLIYLIDNGHHWDEEELFFAVNIATELKKNLVIFMDSEWRPSLADLQSRLNAIHTEIINEPDDELMQIIIAQEFSKRSIHANPEIITYLKSRLNRNFENIKSSIDEIDKFCLSNKRNLTIKAISECLF